MTARHRHRLGHRRPDEGRPRPAVLLEAGHGVPGHHPARRAGAPGRREFQRTLASSWGGRWTMVKPETFGRWTCSVVTDVGRARVGPRTAAAASALAATVSPAITTSTLRRPRLRTHPTTP